MTVYVNELFDTTWADKARWLARRLERGKAASEARKGERARKVLANDR